MKYTEFEKKVKAIPEVAEVTMRGNMVTVQNSSGYHMIGVSGNFMHSIYTVYDAWRALGEETQAKIYKLAYELTSTPLEEREETKKYYYRLPHSVRGGNYLNYHKESNCLFYSTKFRGIACQTQFTRGEYEAIAKEHGIPEGLHLEEEVE